MSISNIFIKILGKIYSIIEFIVSALLIFLLMYVILLLSLVFAEHLSSGFVIQANANSICENLMFWDKYSFLFKSLFGVMTLFVAIVNLNKYIKEMMDSNNIEAIRSLHILRERLENDGEIRKIHEALEFNPQSFKVSNFTDTNRTKTDLLNYLGILELGSLMVQKGVVPIKDFSNQFGYRIQNILESENLVNYIVEDGRYYHDLIWIVKRLVEEKLIESGLYYYKIQILN